MGYTYEQEYPVGRTASAAVDLAWFGAGDERMPLMIFEVESTASASMANNALKVFSQDVEDFVKPIFFFHLLLKGGRDNERIASLRDQWGKYNYRVYRLNIPAEVQRLVSDILGQHRRISATLELANLISIMHKPPWTGVDPLVLCEVAADLQFSANYRLDLARLAVEDPRLRPLHLERLRDNYLDHRDYSGSYATYLGSHYSAVLEISLLAGQEIISDDDATELLDAWQRGPWGLTMIGPHFRLNRDYDQFLLTTAPFLFAIAAILARGRKKTKAWITEQLHVLIKGEQEEGVNPEFITPAQAWLLHIAASALREYSMDSASGGEAELLEIYKQVSLNLMMAAQPFSLILSPPSPSLLTAEFEGESMSVKWDDLHRLTDIPEWTNLSDGYFPEIGQDTWHEHQQPLQWRDFFSFAISLLTEEEWLTWPTNDIIRLLHGEILTGDSSPEDW